MHTLSHIAWGGAKHVAVAYLVYSLIQHGRGRPPTGQSTAVLFFGALFPDVVDKSLAFAGVVGYGRSVTHSLFTAAAVIVAVSRLAHRWNRSDLGVAFGVGYLSHVPVDLYGPLLTGSQSMDTAFLFWPVAIEHSLGLPTPTIPVARSTIFTAVIAAALSLWLSDRMPLVPMPLAADSRSSSSGNDDP